MFRLLLAIAGAIALAGFVAGRMITVGVGHKNKAVMIAVAQVHRSQPVLSVLSTHYADVAHALGDIAFDIVPDPQALFDGAVLQGGATNRILGQGVVYLRFTRNPGEPAQSFLVWPKGELFRRLSAASRDVNGVRVDLWTGPDRVFALARDQSL